MGEMRSKYKILTGKHAGKGPLGDLGLYKKTVMEFISRKQCGCIWLRIGTSGGLV
jgi:hypothetical protein